MTTAAFLVFTVVWITASVIIYLITVAIHQARLNRRIRKL